MAFRYADLAPTPRVLVLRPQRAFASATLFVLGSACALCGGFPAVAAIQRSSPGLLLFALWFVLFGLLMTFIGARAWFLRVEVRAFDDGVLTMTWTRWPFRRRLRSLQLAEVTDVIVESDDGTSNIVLVAGSARRPLTGASTSDRLEGKARQLREFLGVPRSAGGR